MKLFHCILKLKEMALYNDLHGFRPLTKEVPYNTVDQKTDAHALRKCKGPFREYYMPKYLLSTASHIVICMRTISKPAIKSKRRRLLSSGMLLQLITRHFTQHVQQLVKLRICLWGVFRIIHIHLTSHHVTIICLAPSRKC